MLAGENIDPLTNTHIFLANKQQFHHVPGEKKNEVFSLYTKKTSRCPLLIV